MAQGQVDAVDAVLCVYVLAEKTGLAFVVDVKLSDCAKCCRATVTGCVSSGGHHNMALCWTLACQLA